MLVIRPPDPRWGRTFPFLVTPQAEEWLPGILLRTDETNLWEAGTTAGFVSRGCTGLGLNRLGLYISARTFDLDAFAEALAVSPKEIVATTFASSLSALADQRSFTGRFLGPTPPLRICPTCLRESRLIRKESALIHVQSCPVHHVRWCSTCTCGLPLELAALNTQPFVCGSCKQDWSDLRRNPLDPELLDLDAQTLAAYQTLLNDTDAAGVLRLIRRICRYLRRSKREEPENDEYLASALARKASVALLVEYVLRFGLDLDQALARPPRDSRPTCGNRSCGLFGDSEHGQLQKYGKWRGSQWYYCGYCGARFIQDRMVMSFDVEHGSDDLRPIFVAKAQARLAIWKRDLNKVCKVMLEEGIPISVKVAFARADIPKTRNLLATRLGLVAIVDKHANTQASRLLALGQTRATFRRQMFKRQVR